MMTTSDAPFEWIQGRSSLAWSAGQFALFLGTSFLVTLLSLDWLGPDEVGVTLRWPVLLAQCAMLGVAAGVVAGAYQRWVPRNVTWLAITPTGVQVESRMRPVVYSWSTLQLEGVRLEIRSGRFPRLNRRVLRLTPKQAERLRYARSLLGHPGGAGAPLTSSSSS